MKSKMILEKLFYTIRNPSFLFVAFFLIMNNLIVGLEINILYMQKGLKKKDTEKLQKFLIL